MALPADPRPGRLLATQPPAALRFGGIDGQTKHDPAVDVGKRGSDMLDEATT